MAVPQTKWSFFRADQKRHYIAVNKEESYAEESSITTDKNLQRATSWTRPLWLIPWVTTLIFASSTLFLVLDRNHPNAFGSFTSGWATDFSRHRWYSLGVYPYWYFILVTARDAIEARQIRFNGSPSFYDNKTIFIPNPDPVKYVGEPSPELDENWERLTWGQLRN